MGLTVVDLNNSSSGLKPCPGGDGRGSVGGGAREEPGNRSLSARGPDGGMRRLSVMDSWRLRGGRFPAALLGSISSRTASTPSSMRLYLTSQRG